MNCPKCNKQMEIQWGEKPIVHDDNSMTIEVVGRCWDCDYDGTWKIDVSASGKVTEYDLRQFFFG